MKCDRIRIKGSMLMASMLITAASYTVAMFMAGVFPGGEKIFMTGDLYIQYAPLNRLFWKGLLEGKVYVADRKVLFTSIPYDEDWHIVSDGVELETLSLMEGAFLGAKLSEGEHRICIYYENRWIDYGEILSMIGLFGLLVLVKKGYPARNTKK